MKGRFAPSPTGHIHLGNVWVALLSYLSVRQQQGTFLIRMEDIDKQRSRSELGEALLDDLEWLGFDWDEGPRVSKDGAFYWQSNRDGYYESILTQLKERGLLYPCFCNRARLQNIASAPHLGEECHTYDGHCRDLTEEDITIARSQKNPSWRLKILEDQKISFFDRWQGLQELILQRGFDDFVVKRADNMIAYNLAVVLDDIAMGVTEVVRGVDLLTATFSQIALYKMLQAEIPVYGHVPLVMGSDGHRLSKRQRSVTVGELRELGYSAEKIIGQLAVLGGLVDSNQLEEGAISIAKLVGLVENPLQVPTNHLVL